MREEIRSEIDIPHRFNGVVRFAAGAEPPEIRIGGADIGSLLRRTSVVVSLQAHSGIPYTPTTSFSGGLAAGGNALFQLERNSGRGPGSWSVDLRASKGLAIGDVVYSAFIQIDNLFDRKNCLQPLPATGRCDAGSVDQGRSRQGNPVGESATTTFFDRPQLFGPRRQINVGIRVDF